MTRLPHGKHGPRTLERPPDGGLLRRRRDLAVVQEAAQRNIAPGVLGQGLRTDSVILQHQRERQRVLTREPV